MRACGVQGNLAPNGAIIKPSAATPRLLQHTGRAVVFESFEEMRAQVTCFLALAATLTHTHTPC
ncbi:MAG: dihydroxy-acid dehydratase [Terracidiphilus sp.]|nr:dihydroxy-acid dehydratase [Terracidiphilus sp.]